MCALLLFVGMQPVEAENGGSDGTTNAAPVFPAPSLTRAVDENSAVGTAVGDPVSATDEDDAVLSYALAGADAARFAIDTASGQITVGSGTVLDYEAQATYALSVEVRDGRDADGNPAPREPADATVSVTVNVTNVPEGPVWGAEAPTLTDRFSTSVKVSWVSPDTTGRPPVIRFELTAAELDDDGNYKLPLVITRVFVDDGSATSGTLTGLQPSTRYDVSVSASNTEGSSRTASVVFTTQPPNDPPKGYDPATCAEDDSNVPLAAPAGVQVELGPLHGGSSQAGRCSGSSAGQASYFWDADGDALSMSVAVEAPAAAVWRGTIGGEQSPVIDTGGTKLLFVGLAARAATELEAVVTANDGRGGTGSRRVVITVGGFSGSAVPSFASQVADQRYRLGTQITPLVLPAASGGDLGHGTSGEVFDYVYALSGTLPSGLSFDAETRTLSGIPESRGRFAMTYTAQDADLEQGASDTASQTFTIRVPPRVKAVTSYPHGGIRAIGDPIWLTLPLAGSGSGVTVVGSPLPQLAVQVGEQERLASYVGETGTVIYQVQLSFRYTVQEGDWDADGVSIGANALRVNGATVATYGGVELSPEHDALAFDRVHKVDGVRPAVSSATVDGTTLTLTFDEALDTGGAAPAASAFTVKGIGADQSPTGVSLSGAMVRLTLGAAAVHVHDVTVDYEKPSGDALRDAAGNEAASFTGQAVTNDTPDQPEPVVSAASVNGATLTLTFDEDLDTTAAPPASVFTVGGTDATTSVTAVAFTSGDATKLGLTLSPAVEHGDDGITLRYAKGANPLKDGEGNEVADFTGQAVTNDTPDPEAPLVSGVRVSSSAGGDGAYAIGDTISLTATFAEAVTVAAARSGARVVGPRMALQVGTATRHAVYASGSGSTELVFGYRVAEGDADGDGIAVAANALENHAASTVTLSSDGTAATLDHAALAAQASHQVDGVRPEVDGAAVSGTTLTLTFDESLGAAGSLANAAFAVKKTPAGGGEVAVSLSGTVGPSIDAATVTLTLAQAVVATDTGVKVSYAAPATGSANRIVDAVGNAAANFDEQTVRNTADTTAPTFSGASVNRATLTITFSEDLDTTAPPPASAFSVGGTARTSSVTAVRFKSADARKLELTLSPAVSHRDSGITVSYAKGANPLKDGNDNEVASFGGQPVANSTEHATEVSAVRISSQAGDDGTYAIGDRIEATVTFDSAVTVTGTPQLALSVGSETRQAAYAAGSSGGGDGTEVVFGYTVAEGDSDADGVAVAADAMSAGDGAIRSGTADAALSHAAVAASAVHKVDGVRARIEAAPSVTSTPSRGDGYYRSLERITLALRFSEAVRVDTASGTPRLGVSVGANERPAGYDAGSGTTTLTFSWPVKPADLDADGISVAANRLTLRGATITDLAGNAPANLNHAALAAQSGHRVAGNRSPPHFADESVSFTIAEDHKDGALVGTVTANDADLDVLTYTLSGDDAGLFKLAESGPGANLFMAAGARLSHESATSHALTVTATDPAGLSATVSVTVNVTNVPEGPVWGAEAPTLTDRFSTSVKVSWVSPDTTGRPPVIRFELTAAELDDDGNYKLPLVITRVFVDDGSATSGTLTGLQPSTRYDVSVSASNTEGSSRTASVVFTTQPPNDPPKGYDPATCAEDDSNVPLAAPAGVQVELGPLHGGSSQAGRCSGSSAGQASYFWDADGDALSMSVAVEAPAAAVWRGTIGGEQSPVIDTGGTKLLFVGLAARAATELEAVVTANDGRGGTGSRRVVITVGGFSGSAVPSFASQVADQRYRLGTQITPLVLPAASGGDLGHGTSGEVFDYVYALSGTLPSGLSFDAETRTLSGIPESRGRFAMTYTAQDADLEQGASDTASQTFTIRVPPRVKAVTSYPHGGIRAIGDPIWLTLPLAGSGSGVTVVGSPLPQLAVQVGEQERLASYVGETGTVIYQVQLSFRYTVQEGDWDADGVSIGANALRVNGATVATYGGVELSPEHDALAFDRVHKVDGVRPAVSSATVDGTTLTLTFDEALDTGGAAPAASAFSVAGTATATSVTAVAFRNGDATKVDLTVSPAVAYGDGGITVGYTRPTGAGANPLEDVPGNEVATFTGQSVSNAPAAPAIPVVAAASSTSLTASWSAPGKLGSAGSITDYDLRYYAGTVPPANDADWIEEGETGGPPDPGSATTATITGLTANTTYQVQVRAYGDLESPWSAAGSGTTDSAPPGDVLVSNADHIGNDGSSVHTAQSFTTGPRGARISAIQLRVSGGRGSISVKLREDSSGLPGDLVAAFTNPSSIAANAFNSFTAAAIPRSPRTRPTG